MKRIAGIDVGCRALDVCIRTESGEKMKQFPNTPAGVKALCKALKDCERVLMEATGTYHLLCANALHEAGIPVVVVNPRQAHHHAKARMARNKTDRVDARLLAELAKDPSHRLWEPKTGAIQTLQSLTRMREVLVDTKCARIAQSKTPGIPDFEKEFYTSEIKRIEEQVKEVEERINACVENDARLKAQRENLQSVPGIGPIVAIHLIVHLPDGLMNAKQASAYAGLNPRKIESGQMKGMTKISKNGNAKLRKMLYIAAWTAASLPGPLKDFYQRLLQKGKAKAAAMTALANKLIRIAYAILKRGTEYQPSHLKTG